jgi:hypothetical protein
MFFSSFEIRVILASQNKFLAFLPFLFYGIFRGALVLVL